MTTFRAAPRTSASLLVLLTLATTTGQAHGQSGYAAELPETRAALVYYPGRDFALLFESGYGSRIDTFAGIVTKTLGQDSDTTLALRLSNAQLDTLYGAVRAARFFELPEPSPARDTSYTLESYTWYRLWVRAGLWSRDLRWTTKHPKLAHNEDEWRRIMSVLDAARWMIETRAEYQALPECVWDEDVPSN